MEEAVPYHKTYYQNNKEKYRQYRIQNNEKLVEYCKRWRFEHREERREKRGAKVYCQYCQRDYSQGGWLAHTRTTVHINNMEAYSSSLDNEKISSPE